MIHEYPFKSNYLTIDGNQLHYLDEGAGPAIVMVHGNPTWSYYFRNLVKTLSSSYRVIVPDHLGCGLSDKPQEYSYILENHINNISKLIDHLELASLSLVVHDWGGAIGMGYSTKFAEKIDKIVVLNTAAFRSKRIPFRIRMCRWPLIGECIVRGLNGFAWPATFMAVKKKMNKKIVKSYLLPYDSWKNRIGVYGFVRDIPLVPEHVSYNTLKRIEENLVVLRENKIPMMIAWGGRDFCFNDHFFNEWKDRFPDAECHYFPDGGHYILEDEKGIIEPLISDFLETRIVKG